MTKREFLREMNMEHLVTTPERIDAMRLALSLEPRVLARITEEDDASYRLHCEGCAYLVDEEWDTLYLVAQFARKHAIETGHAVLVEAL